MIRIYNAKDQIDANRIIAFLQEEDIPCYAAGSGSGEYMQITMGYSVFGMEIYVREEDSDRAKEIINELLEEDRSRSEELEADTDMDVASNPEEDTENKKIPWYQNQRTVMRLVALVVAIILICKGIVEVLQS